ncbi:ribosomal maturation YjgA family protein [Terrisporobacter sp.]|uniref:ribosomal maturation YjgA family protein n=1 Tax=Terrisporobacter sp. TaxID=1965305 RepID=UPI002F3EA4FF
MKRNKLLYLLLTIIVMLLGLLSRKIEGLPEIISLYSEDILWALMVFLLFAFLFNKKSTIFIISWAIIFSYSIEISQLYHAPWIDSIRNTTLGGLILGFGFLWSDLVCYTIGIIIGIIIDIIINKTNIKVINNEER